MDGSGISQDLQELLGVAGGYLSGNIAVQIKTNYTPALTVYSGSGSSSGGSPGASSTGNVFSRLVGLDVGVKVLDSSGRELASYGDWPDVDWVRVAAALVVVGLLGIGLVKLIRAL